ncbi:MAG: hypothetical protein ACXWJM_06430 [Ramlibacter sp.]
MDQSTADRSTYGLAAGALMVFALFGLGEINEGGENVQTLSAAEIREPEEPVPNDPEYPDAHALVLAVAALLEAP